ncbi:hypothetical protein NDU88_010182 [Pleurodeles waltl]|uniref:Uncharacterized protein n=1 Tax=Pleurodeles waltl TaxID=8319 RepID=A0AAV7PUY8_PLEWA|nr:hypothetical protein NDU88_010182 [Pleurodeles waltl]
MEREEGAGGPGGLCSNIREQGEVAIRGMELLRGCVQQTRALMLQECKITEMYGTRECGGVRGAHEPEECRHVTEPVDQSNAVPLDQPLG